MHCVKMVPTGAAGRFYCLGRVFSGTVTTASYRIQPPNYAPASADEGAAEEAAAEEGAPAAEEGGGSPVSAGAPTPSPKQTEVISVQNGKVQSVHCVMGKDFPVIPDVPAGQVCALAGVDQFVQKSCTITNTDTFNFNSLKFVVSPVVKISLKPKDAKELPKLVEAVKRLSKSDMLVDASSDESGGQMIGGCGDEHLKLLKK